MIQGTQLTKSYGKLQVLKGVSLEIQKGELITIVGTSGAGKSTLLHLLGTLDKPDSGNLIINNTAIHKLSASELAQFRNKYIGFVFQFHHLLPEFTALENVCLPALIAKSNYKDAQKHAQKLLTMLGLQQRTHHKPNELSGGEQQRVAVARALINQPSVVLADEPSGNLDSDTAHELHQLFFTLQKELNQTFVIVTHNEQYANLANRKLVMKDGLIVS